MVNIRKYSQITTCPLWKYRDISWYHGLTWKKIVVFVPLSNLMCLLLPDHHVEKLYRWLMLLTYRLLSHILNHKEARWWLGHHNSHSYVPTKLWTVSRSHCKASFGIYHRNIPWSNQQKHVTTKRNLPLLVVGTPAYWLLEKEKAGSIHTSV